MRMLRLGGGLAAMLAAFAGPVATARVALTGPRPITGRRDPFPEPNYADTQNRTDHQHLGERARRRRQRNAQ